MTVDIGMEIQNAVSTIILFGSVISLAWFFTELYYNFSIGPKETAMKTKKKKAKVVLTSEQIDLAAKYLAMSNICALEPYHRDIKDFKSLERAVHHAWEDAVTGMMESEEGGYDDSNESKAIASVQEEIDSFKSDLKSKKESKYWIEQLKKEIPFLFTSTAIRKCADCGKVIPVDQQLCSCNRSGDLG